MRDFNKEEGGKPVSAGDVNRDALSTLPPAHVAFVVRTYYTSVELAEARRRYQDAGSYTEALAYLVDLGQRDLRRSALYTTIPTGKVLIHQPDRPEGSLSAVPLPQIELARRAFPCLDEASARTSGLALSGAEDPRRREQLTLWGEGDTPGIQVQGTPPEPHQGSKMPGLAKAAGAKKLVYLEQTIVRRFGSHVPGWVVKDRGLGYYLEPLRSGQGYLVTLVHLKSRRDLASAILPECDHERIRLWVGACVTLTDWTRGIQAILREQEGEQKMRAWEGRLTDIWYEQERRLKRQLSLF